jgi:hypothetical protein
MAGKTCACGACFKSKRVVARSCAAPTAGSCPRADHVPCARRRCPYAPLRTAAAVCRGWILNRGRSAQALRSMPDAVSAPVCRDVSSVGHIAPQRPRVGQHQPERSSRALMLPLERRVCRCPELGEGGDRPSIPHGSEPLLPVGSAVSVATPKWSTEFKAGHGLCLGVEVASHPERIPRMNITQAAGAHLDGLLHRIQAPQGAVIRLVPESGSLSLHTDIPRPDDVVFKNGARAVLVVDKRVEAMFNDRTLDVRTTNDGVTLILAAQS